MMKLPYIQSFKRQLAYALVVVAVFHLLVPRHTVAPGAVAKYAADALGSANCATVYSVPSAQS